VSFEDRIAKLECWKGKPIIEPLKGGLSTSSFKVRDFSGHHVVRIGADIPVHHVNRKQERAVSLAASKAGLSPAVTYFEDDLLVIDFIEGQTMKETDIKHRLGSIIDLLADVHTKIAKYLYGPVSMFWVFHVLRDYLSELKKADNGLSKIERIIASLEDTQMPLPIVIGHHDLLPANLIDDGRRLWLIDWEYGGFGTAMFDLANLSSNGNLTEADESELLERYFKTDPTPQLLKAFDAMKIASALREMLWAKISAIHLNLPGVDYSAHEADYRKRSDETIKNFELKYGCTL